MSEFKRIKRAYSDEKKIDRIYRKERESEDNVRIAASATDILLALHSLVALIECHQCGIDGRIENLLRQPGYRHALEILSRFEGGGAS